jgi:hypothetical protein
LLAVMLAVIQPGALMAQVGTDGGQASAPELISDDEADDLIREIERFTEEAGEVLEDLRSDRLHPDIVIEALD